MPYQPWFPEAGNYIKYLDGRSGAAQVKYRKLVWRRDPFIYPRRFPEVTAGAKSNIISFKEINPSDIKKHIFLAYLGVQPGFAYYLYHPSDLWNLRWDEQIEDIEEDLVAMVDYELSPYEKPTKAIGIEHDRYPGIKAKNLTGETKNPALVWIACLYKVLEHAELRSEEINRLESGSIRAYPWDFGGEV